MIDIVSGVVLLMALSSIIYLVREAVTGGRTGHK